MQELLLATNRRSRLRITAVGGGLIGAAITMVVASAAGYWLHLDSLNAQRVSQAQQIQSVQAELVEAKAQAAQAQKALECAPLVWLARHNAQSWAKVQTMVASYPIFKTEPYKTMHADLSAEVLRQGQSATSLVDVMDKTPGRCALVVDGAKAGEPVWSYGASALHKDGWSGVTP